MARTARDTAEGGRSRPAARGANPASPGDQPERRYSRNRLGETPCTALKQREK
jgi:hypothetical protein